MPNRMLRDWTDSEKINAISSQAEVFFTRLIMKADDYGCFYATPALLKAHLFPLKSDAIREADISRWTAECQKAGLIVLYASNGKNFLEIKDFGQRLRAKTRKYPKPPDMCQTYDGHMSDICPPEEKRREVEVEEEVEGKGRIFSHVPDEKEIQYPIEECLEFALKDTRWVKVNKASQQELIEFNQLLERRGIYKKNPADYKQHYSNWKSSGSQDDKNSPASQNGKMVW